MIVCDAGPLIIFARIGQLALLRDFAGTLTIPPAVRDEVMAREGTMPGAAEIALADWVRLSTQTNELLLKDIPRGLHDGEREAIALAREHGAQLLIDEIRGRRFASRIGIEVIGTLGVLAESKRLAHIETAGPILSQMQAAGYRLDRDLLRRFLSVLGEE